MVFFETLVSVFKTLPSNCNFPDGIGPDFKPFVLCLNPHTIVQQLKEGIGSAEILHLKPYPHVNAQNAYSGDAFFKVLGEHLRELGIKSLIYGLPLTEFDFITYLAVHIQVHPHDTWQKLVVEQPLFEFRSQKIKDEIGAIHTVRPFDFTYVFKDPTTLAYIQFKADSKDCERV